MINLKERCSYYPILWMRKPRIERLRLLIQGHTVAMGSWTLNLYLFD